MEGGSYKIVYKERRESECLPQSDMDEGFCVTCSQSCLTMEEWAAGHRISHQVSGWQAQDQITVTEPNNHQLFTLIEEGKSISSLLADLDEATINYHRFHDGKSLLHLAIEKSQYDTCVELIKNAADVNLLVTTNPNIMYPSAEDYTPLHLAASPWQQSIDILQLLLDHGADVNLQSSQTGWTPLHIVVMLLNVDAKHVEAPKTIHQQCEKLKLLLEKGADINILNYDNKTCLHCFKPVINNEQDRQIAKTMLKMVVDRIPDINAQTTVGSTALHTACDMGKIETYHVDMLIEKGADARLPSHFLGMFPIHLLALIPQTSPSSRMEVMQALVSSGGSINFQTSFGWSVLHLLCLTGNYFVGQNSCQLQRMIDMGANVNLQDVWGKTALHYVGGTDVHLRIDSLLSEGADVNQRDLNGCTPLMNAVEECNHSSVSALIYKGADINATDKFGRSALHMFVIGNSALNEPRTRPEMVIFQTLLHDQKLNIGLKDKYGHTAIYYIKFIDKEDQRSLLYDALVARDTGITAGNIIDQANIGCVDQCRMVQLRQKLKDFLKPEGGTGHNIWHSPKDLVTNILFTPGIGIVEGLAEFQSIYQQINLFTMRLADELSILHPDINYKPLLSGGVSEGSKVGLPDEFDYLFAIEGLANFLEADDSTGVPGYIKLKLKEKDNCPQIIQHVTDENGYIHSIKFQYYFSNSVLKILQKSEIWQDLDFRWCFRAEPDFFKPTANVLIELEYPLAGFGYIKLSIDIVPVITLPDGWRPRNAIDMSQLTMYKPTITCEPIHVVFTKCHEGRFGVQERDAILLRLSFSTLETAMIRSLPNCWRLAFMLIKVLKDLCDQDLYTSTYVVKTALLIEASLARQSATSCKCATQIQTGQDEHCSPNDNARENVQGNVRDSGDHIVDNEDNVRDIGQKAGETGNIVGGTEDNVGGTTCNTTWVNRNTISNRALQHVIDIANRIMNKIVSASAPNKQLLPSFFISGIYIIQYTWRDNEDRIEGFKMLMDKLNMNKQ